MIVYVSNVTRTVYTNKENIIQEAIENDDLMLFGEWVAEEIDSSDLVEGLENNSTMTCEEFLKRYREDYNHYLLEEIEYLLEQPTSDYWETETKF